ncbi:MAG: acyl-CoA dehydrogenase family protein, partial [Pirellulales bacterium]
MLTTSPDDDSFDLLCRELSARADELDATSAWPGEQLDLARRHGVLRAFAPPEWGGLDWSETDQIRAFLRLSAACLATTFVLTQPLGAARRIVLCDNEPLKHEVLPRLFAGEAFATVGISHLTTSRRHLAAPSMTAREAGAGFVLQGVLPWVTGGSHAEWILTGADCPDGRQILALLPTGLPGVVAGPPARLVGLSATHTGEVHLDGVELDRRWILAGPAEDVLGQRGSAGTGGLSTSALAVGLADAALGFLESEAARRGDLVAAAEGLREEYRALEGDLL